VPRSGRCRAARNGLAENAASQKFQRCAGRWDTERPRQHIGGTQKQAVRARSPNWTNAGVGVGKWAKPKIAADMIRANQDPSHSSRMR